MTWKNTFYHIVTFQKAVSVSSSVIHWENLMKKKYIIFIDFL